MAPNNLATHPLFTVRTEFMEKDERIALSYERARLVVRTHNLSLEDVQHCTPKFWDLMLDPIIIVDFAMFVIIAAHVGLVVGSLSRHMKNRPDLKPLMKQLLNLDTVGIYLLSERGHGLDAFNIETTATVTKDGYIFNTPREEAAKFMPASNPTFSVPKVALVMGKLIVEGEDRGSRLFIVPVCNDKKQMYKGVCNTRLPTRSGTTPLDFSITTFNSVKLPFGALVASDPFDWAKPENELAAWWDEVWRIQYGTLAVSAPWVNAIRAAAYIGGKYSLERKIVGHFAEPKAIINFRTQQWPVVHALAVGEVLNKWFPQAVDLSFASTTDHKVRHAMAVIVKATVCRHWQRVGPEIAERCGAQGTFEHNYLARIENDFKGVVIAEGDIMTLTIRLFSELVQSHYTVPIPDSSESLLARRANSLLKEYQDLFKTIKGGHRSEAFNSLIVPQSQTVVEAIGQAMAYSAAAKAGLSKALLEAYEAVIIRNDQAWFSEQAGLSRAQQRLKEDAAVSAIVPNLDALLDGLGIAPYVSAPIVSDAEWKKYAATLETFTGEAIPDPAIYVPHVEASL